MSKVYILLLAFILPISSMACLNEFNVNERGEMNEEFRGLPIYYRSFDVEYSKAFVSSFDLSNKDSLDYKDLSNVGVHLAHLGKYDESLGLFQWLNSNHPNEYQIVANLGTLYELNGEVDSALKYIALGMEINSDSHHGSEWVHIKILEAKKATAIDPEWIFNNKVLNLHLTDTVEAYSKEHDQIIRTIWHISHQLEERIPFTPDNDLILANILSELGDLLRIHISTENAYVAYKMSEHYNGDNHFGTTERIEDLKKLMEKHQFDESVFKEHFPAKEVFLKSRKKLPNQKEEIKEEITPYKVYLILAGLLILNLILWAMRRNRNKRKND